VAVVYGPRSKRHLKCLTSQNILPMKLQINFCDKCKRSVTRNNLDNTHHRHEFSQDLGTLFVFVMNRWGRISIDGSVRLCAPFWLQLAVQAVAEQIAQERDAAEREAREKETRVLSMTRELEIGRASCRERV
jgi:hypothetical protein